MSQIESLFHNTGEADHVQNLRTSITSQCLDRRHLLSPHGIARHRLNINSSSSQLFGIPSHAHSILSILKTPGPGPGIPQHSSIHGTPHTPSESSLRSSCHSPSSIEDSDPCNSPSKHTHPLFVFSNHFNTLVFSLLPWAFFWTIVVTPLSIFIDTIPNRSVIFA